MSWTRYNHLPYPPAAKPVSARAAWNSAAMTASSRHDGAVGLLLGDGSVRVVKYAVDPVVWRGLGTIAGSETISGRSVLSRIEPENRELNLRNRALNARGKEFLSRSVMELGVVNAWSLTSRCCVCGSLENWLRASHVSDGLDSCRVGIAHQDFFRCKSWWIVPPPCKSQPRWPIHSSSNSGNRLGERVDRFDLLLLLGGGRRWRAESRRRCPRPPVRRRAG